MRNLFLAFIGFLFLTMASGCGVVRTVAIDTCTNGQYNDFLCPGILEEALPETPVKTSNPKAAPTKAVCHSASAFMVKSHRTIKVLSRSHGQCKEVRKQLQDRVRKVGPGVKCRWAKGQIKCAGLDSAWVLAFFLLLAIGRKFPSTRVACGIIAMLVGMATCVSDANAAACTDAQIASNRVAAQYGMVLYDCTEKKEVKQQLDVKASIYAYFEKVWADTEKVDENPDRLQRIALAFTKVYSGEPIEIQRLALAICLKETGCGFSKASSYKMVGGKPVHSHSICDREVYMSKVEACGVVQVSTIGKKGECARLNESFEYAFKAQLNWLKTMWNEGIKDSKGRLPKVDLYNPAVWKKPLKRTYKGQTYKTYFPYRYAGGKPTAWEYGRIVVEEIYPLMKEKTLHVKDGSFGWVVFLMSLFGRRRSGSGHVGPVAHGYHCPEPSLLLWYQATPNEEVEDLQRRCRPIFTMDGWATAKFQRDNVGTLLSPTAEVSFILVEDIPHLPNCVAYHLEARWSGKDFPKPVFPVLYIGEDYIFVAKGKEDDILNPYLVEEEVIQLAGWHHPYSLHKYSGTFLSKKWSNGDTSIKKVKPSTSWKDDVWEEGPQS